MAPSSMERPHLGMRTGVTTDIGISFQTKVYGAARAASAEAFEISVEVRWKWRMRIS
jgi:hypothetical protein